MDTYARVILKNFAGGLVYNENRIGPRAMAILHTVLQYFSFG